MGSLSRLVVRDSTATSDEALDIARVQALLMELRELLEDDDTDADGPIEALTPLLAGSPQAGLLTQLARLDAEFPSAETSDRTTP